ncbi:MAG TPA: STAS domain-containing protein [Acidimicrobiia bacterium]|jgi:anti-anti-sigma factor
MDISTHDENGWLLVQPAGEIDIATAGAVDAHLAENRDTILDLTGVTFMDSTGLRTVVGAHNRLKEANHRLRIVIPDGPVERIISITGLTGALDTVRSLEDALAAG